MYVVRVSHGLVQATVGVGTVLIWDFSVAFTRGGGTPIANTAAHEVLLISGTMGSAVLFSGRSRTPSFLWHLGQGTVFRGRRLPSCHMLPRPWSSGRAGRDTWTGHWGRATAGVVCGCAYTTLIVSTTGGNVSVISVLLPVGGGGSSDWQSQSHPSDLQRADPRPPPPPADTRALSPGPARSAG